MGVRISGRILGAAIAVALVAGCGTGTIRESTLTPVALGSTDVSKIWAWDERSGTGATIGTGAVPGEVFVGHEFFHARGAEGRNNNFQHLFRGAVRFDPGAIAALPSKSVEQATLRFRLAQSVVRDGDGKSPDFVNLVSCASYLLLANDDWTRLTGKVSGGATASAELIGGDTFVALPEAAPPGGGFLVDVTPLVQRWLAKPEENFGWVLRGRKEAFSGASNEACATRYRDFVLEVRYRVF